MGSMMDFLKLFDGFHLFARFFPACVCVISLIEICIVKFWPNRETLDTVFLIFLLSVLIFSIFIRDCGKNEEKKLFDKLGGYPTTISLRLRDTRINEISKVKYHGVLRDVWGLDLPASLQDENRDPKKSDTQYNAAANKLRVYANSKQGEFPLVKKSLELYNFWRNLYGSRRLFYCITAFALFYVICVECVHFCRACWWLLIVLLFVQLFLFRKYVTETRVIDHAFEYAKTLLEVLEADNLRVKSSKS